MTAEDKHAFVSGLVASHGEPLRRFLLARVRNAADVPDLVQEVFLRLLRIPDHETIRTPEAYLFTIAQHLVQQHVLRQSETPPSVDIGEVLTEIRGVSHVDPAWEVDAQQSIKELQHALTQLPSKAQAAFILHRRDGLSLEQVGERLGVSRSMAKRYLAKALLHFRQRLQAE